MNLSSAILSDKLSVSVVWVDAFLLLNHIDHRQYLILHYLTYPCQLHQHSWDDQGTIQLAPSTEWWKTLDPGKAFLKRLMAQVNTVSMVNGVPVCHNNTDDTGKYLFKELTPSGKYACTG